MENTVETVVWQGVTFRRYPYSKRRTDRLYFKHRTKYLHRLVWEFHNGPIPAGMQVHHKDEDTGNNDPTNLVLLTPKAHTNLHLTEERRAWQREQAARARPLAAAWHQSEEGREWHRKHGRKVFMSLPFLRRVCERCGKAYRTKKPSGKYCSNNCRAAAGRARRRQ